MTCRSASALGKCQSVCSAADPIQPRPSWILDATSAAARGGTNPGKRTERLAHGLLVLVVQQCPEGRFVSRSGEPEHARDDALDGGRGVGTLRGERRGEKSGVLAQQLRGGLSARRSRQGEEGGSDRGTKCGNEGRRERLALLVPLGQGEQRHGAVGGAHGREPGLQHLGDVRASVDHGVGQAAQAGHPAHERRRVSASLERPRSASGCGPRSDRPLRDWAPAASGSTGNRAAPR